jgi:hypothetical protein
MPRTRHRLVDGTVAATSACALVAGLAVVNDDVRGHIVNVVNGDPSGQLSMLGLRADLARPLVKMVVDSWSAHTPLVVFGLASIVLVAFMLRT